jgi:FAD/FMN-containing dehydrogenase
MMMCLQNHKMLGRWVPMLTPTKNARAAMLNSAFIMNCFSSFAVSSRASRVVRFCRRPFFRLFGSDSVPRRNANFARVTPADITYFKQILGHSSVITCSDDLERYNTDWLKRARGQSTLVLRPKSTEEVSQILSHCNSRKLAVVPQGGNTGLVGGSVAVHDEVVLSMAAMNRILNFDSASGVLSCEAGCVLQNLEQAVNAHGFLMPLDLGAKGTCHIGGNVATNAGGIRLVRYGSLHGSVLGLEVVLADGRILDMMSGLRKNNTGYHLKNLFIGSEGTLGVVTQVCITTPRKCSSVNVALLALNSFEDTVACLHELRGHLNEILSGVEFLDHACMRLVSKYISKYSSDVATFDSEYPFYLLVETSGSNTRHDREKLMSALEAVMANHLVKDGVVSESDTQAKALWRFREDTPVSLSAAGAVYKYDLSMPTRSMYAIVDDMKKILPSEFQVFGYGHIGDGNLHLNILVPRFDPFFRARLGLLLVTRCRFDDTYKDLIEPRVYEWVQSVRGSVSAEHGDVSFFFGFFVQPNRLLFLYRHWSLEN